MMSKKNYDAIAAMLNGELQMAKSRSDEQFVYTVRGIVLSLADIMVADNPHFKRVLFYNACGLDENGAPE